MFYIIKSVSKLHVLKIVACRTNEKMGLTVFVTASFFVRMSLKDTSSKKKS